MKLILIIIISIFLLKSISLSEEFINIIPKEKLFYLKKTNNQEDCINFQIYSKFDLDNIDEESFNLKSNFDLTYLDNFYQIKYDRYNYFKFYSILNILSKEWFYKNKTLKKNFETKNQNVFGFFIKNFHQLSINEVHLKSNKNLYHLKKFSFHNNVILFNPNIKNGLDEFSIYLSLSKNLDIEKRDQVEIYLISSLKNESIKNDDFYLFLDHLFVKSTLNCLNETVFYKKVYFEKDIFSEFEYKELFKKMKLEFSNVSLTEFHKYQNLVKIK